ncbi:DUF2744 domain-containing protein [Nocardia salmonicida]|uniref:phage gene 29 protein family protein n=1 Tax=Nocardia salmonicida TaxID=53431 RepID=UPI0033D634EF
MARLSYEACQPKPGEEPNPRRLYRWALDVLPFSGSTPLLVQPEAQEQWSELLWDFGFRHHPELQTKKVVQPWRGQQHSLNGSARVVGIDDPEPDAVRIPDPLSYTPHEQAVMAERLYHAGMIGDRVPKWEQGASAEAGEPFNPSDHSVSGVNGYLLAPIPIGEKRRVIAAEMVGKKRDGILRNPANRGI